MESPSVRASDAERDQASRRLREHFADGRLTSEELDDRLARLLRATTRAEVEAVLADLPALPVSAAERQAELAERRAALWREVLQQTGGAAAPFVICTVIWAVGGANGSFWPAWLLLVAVIPLVRNGWRLYGPSPELERVEAELAHRRERDRRREERREHRHQRRLGGPR